MFRSCQIIIRELCFLLKLYYGIHNSIPICKRGIVAAYHVVWECVVEQWLGVRRTTLIYLTFYRRSENAKLLHTLSGSSIISQSYEMCSDFETNIKARQLQN